MKILKRFRSIAVTCSGVAVILASLYLCVILLVFSVSYLTIREKIVFTDSFLNVGQAIIYYNGYGRQLPNVKPGRCHQEDSKLVYILAKGACKLDSLEFTMTAMHDQDRRRVIPYPVTSKGPGIAILGDSFTWGIGVNDDETYAAQIQKITGRKVYPVAVSSYGTARQLKLFERMGIVDHVDTVIIQYCSNDLVENRKMSPGLKQTASFKRAHDRIREINRSAQQTIEQKNIFERFWTSLKHIGISFFRFIRDFNKYYYFKFSLSEEGRYVDFTPHRQMVLKHLMKQDWILDKRIIFVYFNSRYDMLEKGFKYNMPFDNYFTGKDPDIPTMFYHELGLSKDDFFVIDDHINAKGHRKVARQLVDIIQSKQKP